MMIEKFKIPTSLFDFRRIIFLILQENLDQFVDAVIHQNRHACNGYISVRLSEKIKGDFLPDQNLVFMTDRQYKEYREWVEQRRQAKLDEGDDEDDEDGDDDDDQCEDDDDDDNPLSFKIGVN